MQEMMIREGDYVIIQKVGGDHIRLNRVNRKQKILIEKLNFDISGAIDKPFGLFEACAGKLTPVPGTSNSAVVSASVIDELEDINGSATTPKESIINELSKTVESNSQLADGNKSNDEKKDVGDFADEEPTAKKRQRLTHVEIGALKEAGISTTELVSRLVGGNVAFNERTEFSQQKYMLKKTKKHSDRVLILKPNVRLLAECYYKRSPDRVAHLRLDLLGYLLQMSAVHSSCRVLVYEQVLGLVAGAVVERLGGDGMCIFLHRGDVPQSIPCMAALDFSEKEMSVFYPLRIKTLLSQLGSSVTNGGGEKLSSVEDNDGVTPAEACPVAGEEENVDEGGGVERMDKCEEDEVELESNGEQQNTDDADLEERRRVRAEKERVAIDIMRVDPSTSGCGALDCLILALRSMDAVDVLERTYDTLRLSGTVVVYAAAQRHVVAAYEWLRGRGAVDLLVSDQFARGYQVLPERTRPLMQQPVVGGYVLNGIKAKERK